MSIVSGLAGEKPLPEQMVTHLTNMYRIHKTMVT